jgi:hypothetical protein
LQAVLYTDSMANTHQHLNKHYVIYDSIFAAGILSMRSKWLADHFLRLNPPYGTSTVAAGSNANSDSDNQRETLLMLLLGIGHLGSVHSGSWLT